MHPFGDLVVILVHLVFESDKRERIMVQVYVEPDMMAQMMTNKGKSLLALSEESPVMLIFLRHFGCMFCREALADIARTRKQIEGLGTRIVFVHLSDSETAERFFTRFELPDSVYIGDPECKYYAAFGLVKGNMTQLFGLHSWIRGFQAGIISGHGIATPIGDGFQMPGVFIIQNGVIRDAFIHKLSSDRPDYLHLVEQCCDL